MLKALLAAAVLIVIGAAITHIRAGMRETAAEAAHPPTGQIVMVDGHPVHLRIMGEGPDLVLIHGASGNLRDMTFSLAPLLAKRYRVIVPDRPGLGYTPSLDSPDIVSQASLLVGAMEQIGVEKPLVMGQSYGGAVALAWAVHHPDRLAGLIPLAAPSHPWDTPLDPFYRVTASWWGSALVVPLLTAWVPESRIESAIAEIFAPQTVPEGYDDFVGAGLTLRRATLRANARQRATILADIQAMHQSYDRITVPVEILHGTADTTVSLRIHSEKLVKAVAGATLERLEGIGHMPQHVAQEPVIAAIDRAARRAGLR